jgi:hypothetical protein
MEDKNKNNQNPQNPQNPPEISSPIGLFRNILKINISL